MTNEQIKQEINEMLASCNSIEFPTICRRSMTGAGRNYIINRIIHLVTEDGLPIESTLAHIEQELNGL
jgi:hypothetical protein